MVESASDTATFCATLVDEWIARGLKHAVIAPGSRSTPLALALAERYEIDVHVFHDERSAAFCALGIGVATKVPAVLLCTSGTAATHFHAAVVEAGLSLVPMIVCTADRPPELHGVGAPQTIDQQNLDGPAARLFLDVPPQTGSDAPTWRQLAQRAWMTALDAMNPGPVHVNLGFR
ncbi:MAG: thiamine pyrophosphate-binding protein, partial [Actinomycetota bacterium]